MKKYNGALAQLVEQWPFKPFVTGSNPGRPIHHIMKNLITLSLILFSTYSFADKVMLNNLNGFYATNSSKSKSIAIILHGTRGHQNLEIISSLRESLLNNGIDSLTFNLSYGIKDRVNDFLPCDIEHNHSPYKSINEIRLWYDYVLQKGYKNIYLIGHSRGGLDIMHFYQTLNVGKQIPIKSVFLLAPIFNNWKDTKKQYETKYNINLNKLLGQPDQKLEIDFLGCENITVNSKTFLSYYGPSRRGHGNLQKNLYNTSAKIFIVTASEDNIAADTHKLATSIAKSRKNIELKMIEGADHFFRDLYFDDLMDILLEATTE